MTDQDILTMFEGFSAVVTMAVCILFIAIGLFGGKISIQIGGKSDDDDSDNKPNDTGKKLPC
jgi:hypothetical protein